MKAFVFLPNVLIILLLVSLVSGCQPGTPVPDDLPKLTSCKITVIQDGAPLEGASVVFVSSVPGGKWGVGGTTDASGVADIYTNGRYKGAPAGDYKVVITKTETEPSKLPPAPPQDDPAFAAWLEKAESEQRVSYSVVETKYSDAATTPCEVKIVDRESVSERFDVGMKTKGK